MTDPNNPSQAPAGVPQCYRHPGKETWIRCQRCERPICPDCMREASVGFQCPDCVSRGAKETRTGLSAYGGRRSADPRVTTIALIATNIAVFVAVLATGGHASWLASKLMLTPLGRCVADDGSGWFPQAGASVCDRLGGATFSSGLADGAFWQAITHGFVHVDIIHIAFNCLALWWIGPGLEQILGRARFVALYFVATLVAGATIFVFNAPYVSTLGASGGVFGLLGAMLVLVWKRGGDLRSLGGLLAVNVVITLVVPNISWQGHLGGFVGGALVALIVVFAPRGPRRSVIQWSGIGLLTAVTLAVFLLRAAALV